CAEDDEKSRLAVARRVQEISPAPDRLAIRGQKHCQRPTAMLAEMMERGHVDLINIGPLLAIDFDIDEQFVHHARRRLVLEALMRHHMTPMTGGITNREQNWFVAAFSLRQRFGSPRPPIDQVILVLQEIGTGLCGETVAGPAGRARRRGLRWRWRLR